VILRRCPDHRRPADVDLFDALLDAGPGRHGRRERVQIADQQIERLDAKAGKLVAVTRSSQVRQQPGVDGRMERLDPAVEALREPGQFLHSGHRVPERLDQGGCLSSGDYLYSRIGETGDQFSQPGLVVHADQRPANGLALGHGTVTFLPVIVQP
jgi:hypothetical protein